MPALPPERALAAMAEAALTAWACSGQPLPDYTRGEMPGRILRLGS